MFLSSTLTICSNFTLKHRCFNNLKENVFKYNARYFRSTQSCSWRILFFGNDVFSLPSLKMLNSQKESNLITRLEVVTKATKGNPVLEYSITNKICCHGWPYKSCDIIDFDLGVVVSFGYLIPNDVILKFPLDTLACCSGMINVHASLLPRWRGASPISYAILHGDTKTGVSIMRIAPYRFDIGDIVSQAEVPIKPDDTFVSLLQELSTLGASELIKCIRNLPQCLESAKRQGTTGITYAPKLTKEMAELNFETMDATDIVARERAISHLYPIETYWENVPAKLRGISLSNYSPASQATEPGRIYFDWASKTVHVECSNRTFISFSKIVLSGRGSMSGLDFRNGFLTKKAQHQWRFTQQQRLKSATS